MIFLSDIKKVLLEYKKIKNESHVGNKLYKPLKYKNITNIYNFLLDLYKEKENIIVIAVDSISFEYYIKYLHNFTKDIKISLLTSVFPSTTNVAWSSIISGLYPNEHGMVGVSFKVDNPKGSYIWLNDNINTGKSKIYCKNFSDIYRRKIKTLFENTYGKHIYYGKHGSGNNGNISFLHSELSKGAKVILPKITGDDYLILKKIFSDFYNNFKKIDLKQKGIKWFYIDIDTYIHNFGYTEELTNFFFKSLFELLYKTKNKNNEIIICSDHGQIKQNFKENNFNDMFVGLTDYLDIPISGAGRVLFFYPKKGYYYKVYKYLKKNIGDTGIVLSKERAIKKGLFSKKELKYRSIGDIIAIATTSNFPSFGFDFKYEHGSGSEQEIFVPLLKL